MKKVVLICSHLHSGSRELYKSLDNHSQIQGYKYPVYSSALDFIRLTDQRHKLNNRSSVYMDELLFNYNLSTDVAYKECKFIYVIREPISVLNKLVLINKMKPIFGLRYYSYRLRRLFEMSKRTPGAILLTWEDLMNNRGTDLLEKYIGVKESIKFKIDNDFNISDNIISLKLSKEAEDCYQKYLYYLKNRNLIYT